MRADVPELSGCVLPALSPSVEEGNLARRLHEERFGFRPVATAGPGTLLLGFPLVPR